MSNKTFNREVREKVFDETVATVRRKLYDPALNGVDWERASEAHRGAILGAATPGEFEECMNNLVRELKVSHAGFFSEARPRASAKIAIGATFHAHGGRWIFQDVHPGGPAQKAGVKPADTLLAVAGKPCAPPEMPTFALGENVAAAIERRDGTQETVTIYVPVSKKKNRPLVELQPASWTMMPGGVGYLRISMFPGAVGIDLARDVDRALSEMKCTKLVIDLRGNSGGGMGCLRVMSYLAPGRLGVGYSVTRKDIERPDFDKIRLPQFDRIPDRKLGLIPLVLRFAIRGRSVAVFTEAKGPQPFHGNVAILVNEHTASSSEMVAAFAQEYQLATIVGTRTPGRLLGANSFKVGHGYRIALPVVEYRTWKDARLESKGVDPEVAVPFDPDALRRGTDTQLMAAVDVVTGSRVQRTATG